MTTVLPDGSEPRSIALEAKAKASPFLVACKLCIDKLSVDKKSKKSVLVTKDEAANIAINEDKLAENQQAQIVALRGEVEEREKELTNLNARIDDQDTMLIRQNARIEQLLAMQSERTDVFRDAVSVTSILNPAKRKRRLNATDGRSTSNPDMNEEYEEDFESDTHSQATTTDAVAEMEEDIEEGPVTLDSLAARFTKEQKENRKQLLATSRFMSGIARQTEQIMKTFTEFVKNMNEQQFGSGAAVGGGALRNMRLEYRRQVNENQGEQPTELPRPTRPLNARSRTRTPNRTVAMQRQNQRANDRPAPAGKANVTYAQAVRATGEAHTHVPNIHIPDGNKEVRKELLSDNLCTDVDITTIKNKGKNLISVKCSSAAEAKKMEEMLLAKYETRINVRPVLVKKPMVKVVNIDVNVDNDDIMDVIFAQNKDIRAIQEQFIIQRAYKVTTNKREYRNTIIECDNIKA